MRKEYQIIFLCLLICGCTSKVPVTLNGQHFDEYMKNSPTVHQPTESLYKKWKLVSMDEYTAMNGILLTDLDIWIDFTQKEDETGHHYIAYGGLSSFWGGYALEGEEGIKVLSMGDDRVLRFRTKEEDQIAGRFRNFISNVEAYEVIGSEMRMWSNRECFVFLAFC